jgi:putative ABC transport system ATP-binding protein
MQESSLPALPAITATALVKTFGGTRKMPLVPVLRGLDVSIPQGSMVAIVGPSGCGKSTLLFCLAGLDPVTSGSVHTLGEDLGKLRPTQLAHLYRDSIGFVFQSFNLVTALTARENVVLPERLARRRPDLENADAVLAELGLADRTHAVVTQLSNGEQQRVALALVLASDPPLVFADEPTGALDSASSRLVLDRLRARADGTNTVVMVTHDLDAASLADIVLVMHDGTFTHSLTHPTSAQILSAMESTAA